MFKMVCVFVIFITSSVVSAIPGYATGNIPSESAGSGGGGWLVTAIAVMGGIITAFYLLCMFLDWIGVDGGRL